MMKGIYSLKTKLVVCFSSLLVLSSLAICMIYSYYVQKSVMNNLIGISRSNVKYMLDNTDDILKQCEAYSNWIFLNRNFDKTLLRDYGLNIYNYNADAYKARNVLSDGTMSTAVGNRILSILLAGSNGVRIRYGDEANYISEESLDSESWFLKGKKNMSVVWTGIEKNPSTQSASKYVIPLIRSIIFVDTGKYVGWQLINFSTSMLSEPLQSYQLGKGDSLVLLDQRMRCIYCSTPGYIGTDMSQVFEELLSEKGKNYRTFGFQGEKKLAVWAKSDYSGFYMLQMTDYQIVQQRSQAIIQLTIVIFLSVILVSFFIVVLLFSNLTKPLTRVMTHIRGIAAKRFDPEPAIEGEDEIGILGKEINALGITVKNLLEESKEHEKAKKSLEFKILQNQINPHFIYNALNSIKIMADFQKADGISKVATALGELLRETSKGTSDEITIERELYLISRYVDIQKIRKKGMIRLQCNVEESILQYKIPKFLLQPIVENAAIHGLAGKKGLGTITIEGRREGDRIILSIQDNGTGIPKEKLDRVLSDSAQENKGEKYTSVGLKNTDQRIKLNYGMEYGLHIESRENEYTKITIELPVIR